MAIIKDINNDLIELNQELSINFVSRPEKMRECLEKFNKYLYNENGELLNIKFEFNLHNLNFEFWYLFFKMIRMEFDDLKEFLFENKTIYIYDKYLDETKDNEAIILETRGINFKINIYKILEKHWYETDMKNWEVDIMINDIFTTDLKNTLYDQVIDETTNIPENYQISKINLDLSRISGKFFKKKEANRILKNDMLNITGNVIINIYFYDYSLPFLNDICYENNIDFFLDDNNFIKLESLRELSDITVQFDFGLIYLNEEDFYLSLLHQIKYNQMIFNINQIKRAYNEYLEQDTFNDKNDFIHIINQFFKWNDELSQEDLSKYKINLDMFNDGIVLNMNTIILRGTTFNRLSRSIKFKNIEINDFLEYKFNHLQEVLDMIEILKDNFIDSKKFK